MDYMPEPVYIMVTILLTAAMIAHGMARVPNVRWSDVGWALTMLGWAAVVIRFWYGILVSGDLTISWSGGIGLLLLASGQVMTSLRGR